MVFPSAVKEKRKSAQGGLIVRTVSEVDDKFCQQDHQWKGVSSWSHRHWHGALTVPSLQKLHAERVGFDSTGERIPWIHLQRTENRMRSPAGVRLRSSVK